MSKKKVDEFIEEQNKASSTGNALTQDDSDKTHVVNPLEKESNDS